MAAGGDAIERAYQPPTNEAATPAPPGAPVEPDLGLVRLHLLLLAVTLVSLVITTALMQLELLDPGPGFLSAEIYNRAFTIHGVAGITSFVVVLLGLLPMLVLPSQLGIRYPAWVAWSTLVASGVCAVPWWAWLDPFAMPSQRLVRLLPVIATWCLPGLGLVLAVLGGGRAALVRAPVLGPGLVLGGAGIVAFMVLTLVLPMVGIVGLPAPGFDEPAVSVVVVLAVGIVERHRGVSVASGGFDVAFVVMLLSTWSLYGFRLAAPAQADAVAGVVNVMLLPVLLFLIVRIGRRAAVGSPDPVVVLPVMLALVSLAGAALLWRFLGTLSQDVHLHDTYFVIAPMHLAGGAVLLLLTAACFDASAALFGRTPRRGLGIAGVLALGGGMVLSFASMALAGQEGMPRRYYTYVPQFEGMFEQMATGGLVAGVGLVLVGLAIATGPRRRASE